MNVISEKKIVKISIEYNNSNNEINDVYEWIDKKYKKYSWRITRSGSKGNGEKNKGLIIIEVEL